MASNRTKIAVGVFVLAGLAIAISAILWLGVSNYLQTGEKYVAYFDESVQGLERDSAVKYRGVTVGRVEGIAVAPDATLVEVIFTLDPDTDLDPEAEMVAQLQSVGITGIMYLELDRKTEMARPSSPSLGFDPGYPVVATRPSDLQRLFKGVDSALNQLNALDVKGISIKIQSAVDTLNRVLEDAEIKTVSTEIQAFVNSLERTLDREGIERIMASLERTAAHLETAGAEAGRMVADVRRGVDPLLSTATRTLNTLHGTSRDLDARLARHSDEISRAIADFRRSLERARAFLAEGSRTLVAFREGAADFQRSLAVILQNLEKTAETLKSFTETIATHPAQLLLGDPPPRRRLEEDHR